MVSSLSLVQFVLSEVIKGGKMERGMGEELEMSLKGLARCPMFSGKEEEYEN